MSDEATLALVVPCVHGGHRYVPSDTCRGPRPATLDDLIGWRVIEAAAKAIHRNVGGTSSHVHWLVTAEAALRAGLAEVVDTPKENIDEGVPEPGSAPWGFDDDGERP